METAYTQGKWEIVEKHPILDHPAILVKDGFNKSKNIDKFKVVCELSDWRGDSFTVKEESESRANAKLIVCAPELLDALIESTKIMQSLVDSNILGVGTKLSYQGYIRKNNEIIERATK